MTKKRLPSWIWKSLVAGLCGTIVHSLLMFFKTRAGLLPSFQPYEAFQATLGYLTGSAVPPILPWIISFLNGSTIVGILFGSVYRQLPGRSGATKGFFLGMIGWTLMGFLFFPMIGLGFFANKLGLGVAPALFALAMIQVYGIVMGVVYSALNSKP